MSEETRLLKAMQPYPQLQALFIAALESGCRIGELLALQWRQVDRASAQITLVNTTTKTTRTRTIPITARLRAVMEMRRTAPDGSEHGPDAYVFGNEAANRSRASKRSGKPFDRRPAS